MCHTSCLGHRTGHGFVTVGMGVSVGIVVGMGVNVAGGSVTTIAGTVEVAPFPINCFRLQLACEMIRQSVSTSVCFVFAVIGQLSAFSAEMTPRSSDAFSMECV